MSNIIEFPAPPELNGRIIGLNQSKCQRFQCPGFVLTPTIPYQSVPDNGPASQKAAMIAGIQQGLLDGRLVDVTDMLKDPIAWAKTGLKYRGSETTAVAAEDTEKPKVFLATDKKRGLTYVVTPRDKAHEAELLEELKQTGTLSNIHFDISPGENAPGLGRIQIEELPPAPRIILTDKD